MREKFGTTFIFSTHDPKVMQKAELTFTLSDGHLESNTGEVAHA
jgi:putative ABC transport system ATP-binding protein